MLLLDGETPLKQVHLIPLALELIRGLKSRTGVAIIGCIVQGRPHQSQDEIKRVTEVLRDQLKMIKLKGFLRVVASSDLKEACGVMVQSVGVASLSPNTLAVFMPASNGDGSSTKFWAANVSAIQ